MSSTVSQQSTYDAVADLIRRRTGLVFTGARRQTLEQALHRLIGSDRADAAWAALSRLRTDDDLLDDLVGQITVGETYFFRDAGQFALIRDHVLPQFTSRERGSTALRVWSAGCASGEEPYSLAILAHELGISNAVHVIGTDLSRAALRRAATARYTPWSLRDVSPDLISRYFDSVGTHYELRPDVRDAVDFKYLNLAEDTYPSLAAGIWSMQLILCRNVLIYLDAETIPRVARRLMDSLAQDGWLLLGASDPLLTDLVPCDVVVTEAGLAYRRRRPGSQLVADRVCTVVLPESMSGSVLHPVSAPGGVASAEQQLVPPAAVSPTDPTPPDHDADASALRARELEEAVLAYATGEYERVTALASRLAEHSAAGCEPWVLLVRAAANCGDLQSAGRLCVAALERHPTAAELLYLHAMLLSEAGRLAEAVAALRRTLYLDRTMVVAHLAFSHVLRRLGDREGAERALRNADHLLSGLPADEIVAASDGERAGRLAEMTRVQLTLMAQPSSPVSARS